MDKQIKELKETYKYEMENITFTSSDRANVFRKIKSGQNRSGNKLSQYLPRALSFIVFGVMIFFAFSVATQQFDDNNMSFSNGEVLSLVQKIQGGTIHYSRPFQPSNSG